MTVHLPSGAATPMIEEGRREAAPREPARVSRISKVKKVKRDTSLKRLEAPLLTRRLHRVPRLSSKQRDKGGKPAE